MNQHRWWAVLALALLLAVAGCSQPATDQPSAISSTSAAPATSATPTPSPTVSAQVVEQAMTMYRTFDALHWDYISKKNGLDAAEGTPPELEALLTGDALASEVSYLQRWRSEGWRVVSGEHHLTWLKAVEGATWGDSVVAIQGCRDSSNIITTDASGEQFTNRASFTTAFFEWVDGELRMSYFDRTKVPAVAPCGPSSSPESSTTP